MTNAAISLVPEVYKDQRGKLGMLRAFTNLRKLKKRLEKTRGGGKILLNFKGIK